MKTSQRLGTKIYGWFTFSASILKQTNPSCQATLLHPVEVIYGDYLPGVTLQTAHGAFSGGTRRGPDDAKTGASQLEAE